MSSFLIPNAKLKRIDKPASVSTGGIVTFANGAAIDVVITQDNPMFVQRRSLGSLIAEATAVLYVMLADLDNTTIGAGARVSTALVIGETEQTTRLYEVLHEVVNVHGSLSHVELYVREVAS